MSQDSFSSFSNRWKDFLPPKAIVMGRRQPTSPPAPEEAEAPEIKTELKPETLETLRQDIGDCTRCKLCEKRTHLVFGEGNPHAELFFVGEGPGEEEDAQGRPFVGKSGQLLDRMIEAMGLSRSQVYIANVVKCRPPGNRNPEPDEIQTCGPFLARQIDLIRPKVVVALGKFAAQTLLETTEGITSLRGKVRPYRGAQLMPTFHPAYLLRNPAAKKEAWEDLKTVAKILEIQIPPPKRKV